MDTLGLLLNVVVHPADVQNTSGDSEAASLRESRGGGLLVLRAVRKLSPFIERIFADAACQGAATAAAVQALGPWQIEIVKRSDLHRFVVLPKRWIVDTAHPRPVSPHPDPIAPAPKNSACSPASSPGCRRR